MPTMASSNETSARLATLGSRALRNPASPTLAEIQALGGCVLSQFQPDPFPLNGLAGLGRAVELAQKYADDHTCYAGFADGAPGAHSFYNKLGSK
jgi:hypothetical protein